MSAWSLRASFSCKLISSNALKGSAKDLILSASDIVKLGAITNSSSFLTFSSISNFVVSKSAIVCAILPVNGFE